MLLNLNLQHDISVNKGSHRLKPYQKKNTYHCSPSTFAFSFSFILFLQSLHFLLAWSNFFFWSHFINVNFFFKVCFPSIRLSTLACRVMITLHQTVFLSCTCAVLTRVSLRRTWQWRLRGRASVKGSLQEILDVWRKPWQNVSTCFKVISLLIESVIIRSHCLAS